LTTDILDRPLPVAVEVHSKTGCPYCDEVKKFLAERGIQYKETLHDDDAERQTLYDMLGLVNEPGRPPQRTVPQVLLIDPTDGEVMRLGGARETTTSGIESILRLVPVERKATPRRMRLSRAKGFNLQDASAKLNGLPAVHCARPSRYGNPFDWRLFLFDGTTDAEAKAKAVARHKDWLGGLVADAPPPPTAEEIRRDLRGRNLACWCAGSEPCHVTNLIEIANG
jgi:glutaredoxin